jgi:hypothetical protein
MCSSTTFIVPKIFGERPPSDLEYSGAIFQREICSSIRGEIEQQKTIRLLLNVLNTAVPCSPPRKTLAAHFKRQWQNMRTRFGSKMFRSLALVFGIAWICEAWAQSSLPPCASTGGVWNRCIGTRTYPSGQTYVGEWKDGKRNGQGTLTFPDGGKYVGEWKDNKRNGQGTHSWPDGPTYVGEWKDNMKNGRGTETTPDGAKYVGEWKDQTRHGLGTYISKDGSKSAGRWENDIFLGEAGVLMSPRRVALIIGNSNYAAQGALLNPKNDAGLIASVLRTVGFQTVEVKTDLTHEQMLKALQDFAALADNADWSVVYYSGHGIAYNGINYMIPVDAKLKADRDIDIEAMDVGKISTVIAGASKLRLIVLDMCRSNPFVKSMTRTIASRGIGRGLAAPAETEAGEYTAFAAKDGQEALDGDGNNSPFADALAHRLQMPNVDVRRVFDYVRDDVLKLTNRQQQPFTYGSLPPVDFYFAQK